MTKDEVFVCVLFNDLVRVIDDVHRLGSMYVSVTGDTDGLLVAQAAERSLKELYDVVAARLHAGDPAAVAALEKARAAAN